MGSMPVRVSPEVGYELWAPIWDAQPSAIAALEERTLRPLLDSLAGKRFVEASCGTGRWLAYAREQNARAVGFDLSPAMLAEAARKPGLRGRIALAGGRRLPIRDGSADVVLSALSLGHIPPAATTFAELARLVAHKGRLIVTDVHPDASRAGWKRTFRNSETVYEVENHPYSISALQSQALELGLTLEHMSEPCFGERERKIFERRGKAGLFDEVQGVPAVFVAVWRRHSRRALPPCRRGTVGA